MRLSTCNSRRKRLFGKAEEPKGTPFCYIVYGKRVTVPVHNSAFELVNYEVQWREWKRPFDDYGEAIAHLTRVKLAIDEEDEDWNAVTPCKIVEGVYTKPGKEKITKVTRLNDECDRPPERHFSSGLPRKQRKHCIPTAQDVARRRAAVWSSWTTASSGTIPTVGTGRLYRGQVSDPDRWYSATTN